LIKDGATPTTVEGKNLCISVVKGKVKLNGTINVIQTDIMNKKNSNGVVHVIDGVLYPIGIIILLIDILYIIRQLRENGYRWSNKRKDEVIGKSVTFSFVYHQ
jgi:hypothetical protein